VERTNLSQIRAVLFDMDGVVYVGDTPLPGAQEIFDWLGQTGRPYVLVTNNSTRTPGQYVQKLQAMGIQVPLRTIYTSALATAEFLKKQYAPGTPIYMIGEAGLAEALGEAGFARDEDKPVVVCVGLDQQLTYAKLRTACLAIRAGARFIGTNPDRTLPTEAGLVPGNGAVLSALEIATDVAPLVIGKPSATMIELAVERLGVAGLAPDEIAIIGDRLDTDILAGHAAGIVTVLVLTGVHQVADITLFPAPPDYIVDDLIQFQAALAGQPVARRYLGSTAGVS
jgi:4-nitrophenyl phosphatase